MDATQIEQKAKALAEQAASLAGEMAQFATDAGGVASQVTEAAHSGPYSFISLFTVFILACFVGYCVVWRVTPALHSPLMGVTNAISSVIIVGALIAAGPAETNFSQIMGFCAVVLASVNIFGGFIVTQRMLSMFKKKR